MSSLYVRIHNYAAILVRATCKKLVHFFILLNLLGGEGYYGKDTADQSWNMYCNFSCIFRLVVMLRTTFNRRWLRESRSFCANVVSSRTQPCIVHSSTSGVRTSEKQNVMNVKLVTKLSVGNTVLSTTRKLMDTNSLLLHWLTTC